VFVHQLTTGQIVLKKPTDLRAAKRKGVCMSTYRVHVTNGVEKISGFVVGVKDHRYAEIGNRGVVPKDGHFYIDFSDVEEISPDIKKVIMYVTSLETTPRSPSRERGVYKLNTAEVVLDYYNNEKPERGYRLDGVAKKPEDLKVLNQRIKAGIIRPEPEKSFDAEQIGKIDAWFRRFFDRLFNWSLHPAYRK
jgi:hypothetical protein